MSAWEERKREIREELLGFARQYWEEKKVLLGAKEGVGGTATSEVRIVVRVEDDEDEEVLKKFLSDIAWDAYPYHVEISNVGYGRLALVLRDLRGRRIARVDGKRACVIIDAFPFRIYAYDVEHERLVALNI
ncbi:MAG: hypothetical protein LM590_14130 [Thermofilum sp.]|jgi:hypothetical protein|nr:hypothetical protein [Thermofilum sp.]